MVLLRGVYLAGTEPHAEFYSSGVTSVPWLCFNIHSITFPFIEMVQLFADMSLCDQQFNSNKIVNSSISGNYNFNFDHMAAILQ